MAEKLNPFYKLLKTEVPINITSDLKETFDSVNKAHSGACELALKQPIPGKQLVLMRDASLRSAGYALMIEDNPNQKIQSKRKTYALVAFGSKIFSPAQLKMSIHSKEFLAIYMAFLKFAHILWETTKPTIVFTDNKSVTRFFQSKAIPPSLWNACDYVLQFNFKIADIAGSVNTAADLFSTIRIESHGEDPSQGQGRCTNNTHWSHKILFGCCRGRTVFFHANWWSRWNRRTDPTK